MIPSAFENVKRLSDAQLQDLIADARKGDMSAIQALNLTSATPVLAEMMRREQMREMFQQNMSPRMPGPQTVLDKILAKAEPAGGIGGLETPGVMEEDSFASGGIVSFQSGGQPDATNIRQLLRTPEYYGDEVAPQQSDEVTDAQWLKMTPDERRLYDKRMVNKEIERRREALGPQVTEMTPDESEQLFEERLKLLQGVTKPYQERMQKLIEQGRINEPQRKEELERAAINRGFASMIGAPRKTRSRLGSFAQNVGAAVQGGMGSYEKGIAQLEESKRLQARAELDALKAESAFEKGNFSEARKHVDDMVDARRNAARARSQAERNLTNEEKLGIESIDREYRARLVAEQQQKATEAREKAAEKAAEARIRAAEIRAGGGGGPRQMTEGQYLASIAREEKSIRENTTRMAELRKIHGRGEALDDAIYKLAIDKVNRSTSERTGKPAPKPSEKPSGKPSATLPEGAVVVPLLR